VFLFFNPTFGLQISLIKLSISVIMDTTMDCSKTDQLSKVFRYMTLERNQEGVSVDYKICESFLGFTDVESQTGQGLASVIIDKIESVSELSKVRGQGYDGAANMSGKYGGVQRLKAPNARYMR